MRALAWLCALLFGLLGAAQVIGALAGSSDPLRPLAHVRANAVEVDDAHVLSNLSRDHARALRMSKRLDFGVVWINTHIPFVSEMPHGGFKHSGYGKDLSMYGLEDYTRIKHVMSYIGE